MNFENVKAAIAEACYSDPFSKDCATDANSVSILGKGKIINGIAYPCNKNAEIYLHGNYETDGPFSFNSNAKDANERTFNDSISGKPFIMGQWDVITGITYLTDPNVAVYSFSEIRVRPIDKINDPNFERKASGTHIGNNSNQVRTVNGPPGYALSGMRYEFSGKLVKNIYFEFHHVSDPNKPAWVSDDPGITREWCQTQVLRPFITNFDGPGYYAIGNVQNLNSNYRPFLFTNWWSDVHLTDYSSYDGKWDCLWEITYANGQDDSGGYLLESVGHRVRGHPSFLGRLDGWDPDNRWARVKTVNNKKQAFKIGKINGTSAYFYIQEMGGEQRPLISGVGEWPAISLPAVTWTGADFLPANRVYGTSGWIPDNTVVESTNGKVTTINDWGTRGGGYDIKCDNGGKVTSFSVVSGWHPNGGHPNWGRGFHGLGPFGCDTGQFINNRIGYHYGDRQYNTEIALSSFDLSESMKGFQPGQWYFYKIANSDWSPPKNKGWFMNSFSGAALWWWSNGNHNNGTGYNYLWKPKYINVSGYQKAIIDPDGSIKYTCTKTNDGAVDKSGLYVSPVLHDTANTSGSFYSQVNSGKFAGVVNKDLLLSANREVCDLVVYDKDVQDSFMWDYCATHLDDPYCACRKDMPAELIDPGKVKAAPNPLCWNQPCVQNGYQFKKFKDMPCANIYNCSQVVKMGVGGQDNIFQGVNISQQCGEEVKGKTNNKFDTLQGYTNRAKQTATNAQSNMDQIKVALMVVLANEKNKDIDTIKLQNQNAVDLQNDIIKWSGDVKSFNTQSKAVIDDLKYDNAYLKDAAIGSKISNMANDLDTAVVNVDGILNQSTKAISDIVATRQRVEKAIIADVEAAAKAAAAKAAADKAAAELAAAKLAAQKKAAAELAAAKLAAEKKAIAEAAENKRKMMIYGGAAFFVLVIIIVIVVALQSKAEADAKNKGQGFDGEEEFELEPVNEIEANESPEPISV